MKNIVTYVDFDCGTTFYPEAPTEVDRIIRSTENEKKNISRSSKKPKCIPSNNQRDSIHEQHTSNIFLSSYNLWNMDAAALLLRNQTNDRDSICNQYPQTTTHQPRTDL